MDMISEHKFELVINIPKNHTKRELTNGYKIRRASIDHNIPLLTNARLASAFIEAFCNIGMEDIEISYFSFLTATHTNLDDDLSDCGHFHKYAVHSINPNQHLKSISFRYSELLLPVSRHSGKQNHKE